LGDEITASSTAADLESTLQLLPLYLSAPRRDPAAFAAVVAELRAEPSAEQRFSNALFPEIDAAAIAARLDLDRALEAYRARFGNMAGTRVVIVADLAVDAGRALVERYIASLPGDAAGPRSAAAPSEERARTRRGVARAVVPGRPGEQSRVVLKFDSTARPSPEARMLFRALDVHLREGLRKALREELGGVYDVDLVSHWSGEHFSREVRFDCKPEQVDELVRAARSVIARIVQPGLSSAELDSLRQDYDARFPAAFADDGFWFEELIYAQKEQADARRILELPKLGSRLDRSSMSRAARQFLPLDRYRQVVWAPASAELSR
jgi:zinc protease